MKNFTEYDRLIDKPFTQWGDFDKRWFKYLLEKDRQCRYGDGANDHTDLIQLCDHIVESFLGGRSVDELSGKDIDRYNNLNAMLRQALKEEREREEEKLKGLRSEYTTLIPDTIH